MDTSPTLSFGGSRARTALLATTGTGSADRRVVFLASQPNTGGHDTRTWPHQWSPYMTGNNHKSPDNSPHTEQKLRMPRGQVDWSSESVTSNNIVRQTVSNSAVAGPSGGTSTRNTESTTNCSGFRLGVYGWRKRCLYSLVLSLMVMVILNMALTLWLLKVMEFSSEGIGSLKVVPGGLELKGQATILDALVASSVRSPKGRNLILESWNNFTASARSREGRLLARFTLGEEWLDCVSKGFRVTDPQGVVLFSVDSKQVVVGAETLRVTGVGGAVFQGSVQTPLVRAESGHDLRLESSTRSLNINAPQRITIESQAGNVTASCLSDMKLESVTGIVKMDAASIFLKGLQTAKPNSGGISEDQHSSSRQKEPPAYQLCACETGKLFLARPEGSCRADDAVCR
ncbi:delta-sarcoglycan isoform X1 [Neodiprion pinetum]|uniref:Delta-sarcoglycan isoform X1 n=2 Tax=Neodiprion lecontei TaxID=441921 RepID=A0ABM3GJH0_NEOLC|nr:delta-sarcoglycan isoform X1 [Neodiprion fabricii]XP_046488573.1 delta-sarcoglycan isoform X1 [Neodiprion pinetum]XP_046600425.1 delta-sarcoglycan isoform X1 [Neodiprion lecontei]XP_046623363.1 delta-sarcoglycan isoform X1 [Neodiprion virginianus]